MMSPVEHRHGPYLISTDPTRFDVESFHRYLSDDSYWAKGRTRAVTDAAVDGSLLFGAYTPEGEMVGAARVVTDGVTFAWICDVYVLGPHRSRGLGKALMKAIVTHPAVVDCKRVLVVTADAHELYRRFGFTPLQAPERWMEYGGRNI